MELSLTVAALGAALEKGSFVTARVERLELTSEGILGDRHAGLYAPAGVRQKHHPKGTVLRNARQLSALGVEELKEIAAALELPEVRFEWLGGNLLFEGLGPLTRVPPSSRLLFPSGACVAIDDENLPCTGPGKVIQQQFPAVADLASRFVKAAMHKRGLVGWVERPGVIARGDVAKLILPRANKDWRP
ncbi:MAG: MOSC domain-containing protein [Myxococcaceae bacterium]